MRRTLHVAAAVVLLAGGAGAAAAAGSVAARGANAPACDTGTLTSPQDIDADGTSDLVVGIPYANAGAGAVDVHYGADDRTGHSIATNRFTAARFGLTTAEGDRFGASVSFAEVDGNDCRELAIGEPGADGGRGAVVIALGSRTGVAAGGAIVLHGASTGEHFGAVVRSAGNDLWVSAPDRAVSGHPGAGAVDHYRITGGSVSLVQHVTESTANVPGVAEAYDHFGSVLGVGATVTNDGNPPAVPEQPALYVGVPYEDVGRAKDAGDVVVLYQSAASHAVTTGYALSQDSPGVSGHAEAGDHFGAALAGQPRQVDNPSSTNPADYPPLQLYVGVPDEAIGSVRRAGMVQVFDVSPAHRPTEVRSITQESPGVPGASETGDRFGAAIAFGEGCNGPDYDVSGVAIGAPGESLGAARQAGAVTVVAAQPAPGPTATCPRAFRQGATHIGGTPETGDHFGAALGQLAEPYMPPDFFGHFDGGGPYVVGVPGEDLGGRPDAGAVQLVGDPATFYDSAGTATAEEYGGVPAWSVPNYFCFC